jgi:MSHA biogenesis protein MshE
MAKVEKYRLGELLVEQSLISPEQLQQALDEQQRHGRKLGRVLVENGWLTEEQIAGALARQLHIPYVNLQHYNVNTALARKLPEAQARRFHALPLEDRGDAVLLGMVDPTDLFAYDEVSRLLKRPLDLAVVAEDQLLNVIDRVYRKTEEISGLARELEQEIGTAYVDFGAFAAAQSSEDAPVVKLLQSLFEDAIQVRASDIHIEPQEGRLQIRFRIDGVLHVQTETDIRIASALVVRLKLMAGLDISEKRLPQDGRFNIRLRDQEVDVRMSTLPTQFGESVVMRLLNQSAGILALDSLGMPPDMLREFRRIIRRPSGMVVLTGPTGSGKTTTLYAALSELNSRETKIITVENPVEYRLPGINQVQVAPKIDLTFGRVLRAMLRQDPDIILVGEMRDQETAQIGLRAAMTGHLVLSTLHTNDAVSTPVRLIDMGVPPYMVASSLLAVLAQRLVRLVCDHCGEPYEAKPHEREWLRSELTEDELGRLRLRHGKGCSRCNGTGYLGRTAVYEMLEMTAPLAAAAARFEPEHFARVAQEQMAGDSLRRRAVTLALTGRTTVAEAMRISNQLED